MSTQPTVSLFWRDAINPKEGAKIVATYPSGSTVDFTKTAARITEAFEFQIARADRHRDALEWVMTRAAMEEGPFADKIVAACKESLDPAAVAALRKR